MNNNEQNNKSMDISEKLIALAYSCDSLKDIASSIVKNLEIKKFNVIIDKHGNIDPRSELELRIDEKITDVDKGLKIILHTIHLLKPESTEEDAADIIGFIEYHVKRNQIGYTLTRKFYIYD